MKLVYLNLQCLLNNFVMDKQQQQKQKEEEMRCTNKKRF